MHKRPAVDSRTTILSWTSLMLPWTSHPPTRSQTPLLCHPRPSPRALSNLSHALYSWSRIPCILTPLPSSRLKLNHSTLFISTSSLLLTCPVVQAYDLPNAPLSPLFIQNTMSTFLTTNRIALLQRDLGVTVATQIVDRGTFDLHAAYKSVATWRWSRSGNLVGIARHI